MADQYLRKCTLVVVEGEKGLDLSAFKIRFTIVAADTQSPNVAFIRVYNLSQDTAKKVQGEYSRVVLNAGYENGAFGLVFDGTIKQVRRGRENALNSYVDIFAAEADIPYNFGVVNSSLEKGSTTVQRAKAITQAWDPYGVSLAPSDALSETGGILPRGKVLFGMARWHMRRLAQTTNSSWTIQDGKVVVTPLTSYREDQVVVLNSQTGLIGQPEATNEGIMVTCLLNPKIVIGTRVQINNKDINQVTVKEQGFPEYTSLSFPANVTDDGIYRVLVAEHTGDTRGAEWYTNLVCLSVDPSVARDASVKAYG